MPVGDARHDAKPRRQVEHRQARRHAHLLLAVQLVLDGEEVHRDVVVELALQVHRRCRRPHGRGPLVALALLAD
eukprot:15460911-Alexandrium_andersonii.AAC.1